MRQAVRVSLAVLGVCAGLGLATAAKAFTYDTHVYGGGAGTDLTDPEDQATPKSHFQFSAGGFGGDSTASSRNDLFLHSSDPNFATPAFPYGNDYNPMIPPSER